MTSRIRNMDPDERQGLYTSVLPDHPDWCGCQEDEDTWANTHQIAMQVTFPQPEPEREA